MINICLHGSFSYQYFPPFLTKISCGIAKLQITSY